MRKGVFGQPDIGIKRLLSRLSDHPSSRRSIAPSVVCKSQTCVANDRPRHGFATLRAEKATRLGLRRTFWEVRSKIPSLGISNEHQWPSIGLMLCDGATRFGWASISQRSSRVSMAFDRPDALRLDRNKSKELPRVERFNGL